MSPYLFLAALYGDVTPKRAARRCCCTLTVSNSSLRFASCFCDTTLSDSRKASVSEMAGLCDAVNKHEKARAKTPAKRTPAKNKFENLPPEHDPHDFNALTCAFNVQRQMSTITQKGCIYHTPLHHCTKKLFSHRFTNIHQRSPRLCLK